MSSPTPVLAGAVPMSPVPARRLHAWSIAWLALPAALLLAAIYAYPMIGVLRTAFNEVGPTGGMVEAWSLATARTVFSDQFTLELTFNSLRLSVISTFVALLLAYPLSLFLYRAPAHLRGPLTVVAIMPMLVSSVVRSFGWLAILGDKGLINSIAQAWGLATTPIRMVYNWTGVTVGMAEVILPYMILALLAGFGRLDRSLEEAARSLGCPPWRAFLRVTLPLSLPGIALSVGLGFVLSMSAYVTPKLLGGGRVFVLGTEIYEQATTNTNLPVAAVLATYTLALLLALLVVSNLVARRIQK
ncbi:MAG TPA: ABC transporter permease [Ramlibacter sp.]|nr:ABC transporter permease [Ramlibacter sp.]